MRHGLFQVLGETPTPRPRSPFLWQEVVQDVYKGPMLLAWFFFLKLALFSPTPQETTLQNGCVEVFLLFRLFVEVDLKLFKKKKQRFA